MSVLIVNYIWKSNNQNLSENLRHSRQQQSNIFQIGALDIPGIFWRPLVSQISLKHLRWPWATVARFLQKTVLPALLRLNPRRLSLSTQHTALRAFKQVHVFNAGNVHTNPHYFVLLVLIVSSGFWQPIKSIHAIHSLTTKYCALSNFETQVVPEVDNVARDVYWKSVFFFTVNAKGLIFIKIKEIFSWIP